VIAGVIFSLAIVFFYVYILNDQGNAEEKIELLAYDGRVITNFILSEGYPANWNSSSVMEIGILSEGKINETKASEFYLLAENNYEDTKSLFNTIYDYYFFLETEIEISGIPQDGIGKPGVTRETIAATAENLAKIERIVVYQDKPMGATLYIWEE